MPPYQAPPTGAPPLQLLPGVPGYAFGSRNVNLPTTRMTVTAVAVSSNVVTLSVIVLEGNIPVVGQLITVTGTTSDGGAANVANIALTGVTITAATGKGTVTYAATASDQVKTSDSGTAYVLVGETGDALTNSTSQQFALPSVAGQNDNGLTLTWSTNYPVPPATVSMALQAAEVDVDSQYSTLDTSTNVGGEIRSLTLRRYRFLRVVASNVTGTNPTAVVRIDI
jgi:hypothetical protein